MWSEPLPNTGYKKKLYAFRPSEKPQAIEIERTKTQRTRLQITCRSSERLFREMMDQKVSGTYVGLWLLVAGYVRLGAWDLVKAWCGTDRDRALHPHLAMQLVNEAALCLNGIRFRRTLRQKGFEAANGLGFVASDQSIHDLLDTHTVADSVALQQALAMSRKALGHFSSKHILLDPHRIPTTTRRQMHPIKTSPRSSPSKAMQTFFAVDADTSQPLGFEIGSPAVTTAARTVRLLHRLDSIVEGQALFTADAEHYCIEIMEAFLEHPRFSLLVPMHRHETILRRCAALEFTPYWAGYAVAEQNHLLPSGKTARLIVQRTHEVTPHYDYKPFLTNSSLPAHELMTLLFPQRWNIEEFFNTQQAIGWNRASTFNLNIRYGKASLALIAQAALCELRKKLTPDIAHWNSQLLAQKILGGIDGDIRVKDDTILVTFYNAPEQYGLRKQFQNLPSAMEKENINPKIPWLCDFKVDFRFK